eukprot:440613_1
MAVKLSSISKLLFILILLSVFRMIMLYKNEVSYFETTYIHPQSINYINTLNAPQTIWILWYDGWNNTDNIPYVVKQCLLSWIYHNKNDNWKVIKLDKYNLKYYIKSEYELFYDIFEIKKLYPITTFSDIIRISLLNKYGGIWIDSTVFCHHKLSKWFTNHYYLNNKHNPNKQFFAFNNISNDRMIASWFLFGNKNNYIINKWYNKTIKFWLPMLKQSNKKFTITYFWFHYLFNELYLNDKLFKQMWDNIKPKISSIFEPENKQNGPAIFWKKEFSKITEINKQKVNNNNSAPMYKLTFKCHINYPKCKFLPPPINSSVHYLFNTIQINKHENIRKLYQNWINIFLSYIC